MASAVYQVEELTLQDDRDVTVKPLPIARLRRFMEAWEKSQELESNDAGFDVLIDCSGISLEHEFKEDFENLEATVADKKKGKVLSDEYKTYLENVLDLETIYKILWVAGGLKLDDPKAIQEAAEALRDLDGQN